MKMALKVHGIDQEGGDMHYEELLGEAEAKIQIHPPVFGMDYLPLGRRVLSRYPLLPQNKIPNCRK
jgi:hypothetical protein